MEWTAEQIDELIELALPCPSEVEYQRALVEFARRYGRSARIGLDEGDQLLRRRSTRRTDYQRSDYSRSWRGGLKFTWMEQRILNWAFGSEKVESRAKPTADYIACMIRRPVHEVETAVEKMSTTRHGIKGFAI